VTGERDKDNLLPLLSLGLKCPITQQKPHHVCRLCMKSRGSSWSGGGELEQGALNQEEGERISLEDNLPSRGIRRRRSRGRTAFLQR